MQEPGISVFQGASSVHVANLSIDEEEEERDRHRRHGEIQEELEKMMENETMEESELYDTPYNQNGIGGYEWSGRKHNSPANFPHVTGDGMLAPEDDGLRRALELRNQEIVQLQKTLAHERKTHETEMKNVEKHLAIINAEKERAVMTREQTHELLVENKTKYSELESTVMRLHENIDGLKKENSDLLVDIENTNRMLRDSEMKRQIAENNAHRGKEQLREVEKKNAEVEMLQERVNCLQNKVFDGENELKLFEKKYRDLERSREALLRDKTETINDLMRELNQAQGQCNELLTRPDITHENYQLRMDVRAYEKQTEDMQKRINLLQLQLDSTNRDLHLIENLSGDLDTKFLDTDQKLVSSTPLSANAKNFTIRDELYRALINVKEKREEIQKLQEEIHSQNQQIETLKETENDSLIKINEYKDELLKLTKKLRFYESQSKENREMCDECAEIKLRLVTISKEHSEITQNLLKESQKEIEKLKNEYCSLSADKNSLVREINELKSQDFFQNIERLQTECQSLRQNLHECQNLIKEKDQELDRARKDHGQKIEQLKEEYEKEKSDNITKHRSLRNDSNDCFNNQMAEVTKQEIENIQLQKDCANYMREISHLRAELKESAAIVNDLHARLGLKEEQNRVIADLKEQAAKFGEYIKNCSSSSTPQKVDSRDASVSTSPEMERYSDPALYERYAKAYAEEIKKLEKQFTDKEMRAQEAIKKLIAYREQMHREFQEKIHILKMVIVSERKEHDKLMEEKEHDKLQSLDEHRKIVEKYKEDLSGLRRQIEELQALVKELRKENEMEKNAVMELMSKWNCEKESVKVREVEMQRLIEETMKKYDSAKMKAQQYKKYSEEHESHMKKEYDRIKRAYESYKAQIEDRIKDLKENYDKITEKKIAKIEEQYMQKLDELRRM
ncbi:hypothetical protein DMENIID0001_024930 [Sergentomyia squamirostris]